MSTAMKIDSATAQEIHDMVYDFFAEECDVDRDELADDTDIVETLEGDSLMLLSLLEQVRKKYQLTIELKALGRHLMQKPADTIGQIVELSLAVVKHGDDILNADL